MPGPLSWFFHHLPDWAHRIEVLGNHVAQLVAPLLLFAPQPVASAAAAFMIVTQLWLVASGNFAWLNWLTIVLAVSVVSWVPAVPWPWLGGGRVVAPAPVWYEVLVIAYSCAVVVLSYRPALNLVSRRQLMNASFDPFHLVNTYGAFGSITRRRYELVIEGTADAEVTPDTVWREYEFKGKPGDPRRRPPQVAPYHLRLDWLMWFAALSPAYAEPWLALLLYRLLTGDPDVLPLLRGRGLLRGGRGSRLRRQDSRLADGGRWFREPTQGNPFPDAPPVFIRVVRYRYKFTSWRQLRETGAWWDRSPAGEFVAPVRLRVRR